ncbi:MAG: glycosyltransferase [Clostridia bacterium]|nr:glycosyltransferase [Clostridia bacterium]
MKITLVADVYGQGNNGTAITAKRLVEQLKLRGHEVKVISCDKNSDYVLPKRNFYCFNNYLEKQNGVALADIDEEILRDGIKNSDVVHILLPFKVGKRAIKICQELEIPYTTAFHCQPENFSSHLHLGNCKPFNNWLYKYYLRTFYKNAHFIHCPSQFIADEITKFKYKASKYVISNGVAEHIKPMNVEKPEELKDKFVVLFVGRYSREKRHDLLIKAVEKSKYKDKIQLIFAGNGPLKTKLEKMSKKLPNKPIFKFFPKDELPKVLNYSDLYVHPSDVEIEAISCLEAITCGQVPIISNSSRTATKNFALDEKCLFEAGNSSDLAQKIDYFIEHEQEKKELSKKYIEYAKQFSIKNSIDKMEEMFCDAIEFYKEYYKYNPKKPIKPQIDYPEDNPEKHMLLVKKKQKNTK